MSAERFARIQISLPEGGEVPLSALARIRPGSGPVKIGREGGARFALVQANVDGRDLVGFVDEAKRAVASRIALPAGYSLQWADNSRTSSVQPRAWDWWCRWRWA